MMLIVCVPTGRLDVVSDAVPLTTLAMPRETGGVARLSTNSTVPVAEVCVREALKVTGVPTTEGLGVVPSR